MEWSFGAFVVAAVWSDGEAAFALGDGTVRWASGAAVQAHDGAALCAVAHPGVGLLTGGDDGRLVQSTRDGASELAVVPGRWIERVAASAASGLIGFGAGRELHIRDAADPVFARVFSHERTVADLAFDMKGRRIATATYGGAQLWFARIEQQKPTMLRFAGSHIAVAWSPDGKHLITAMQDNQLHGWRLPESKDMRMGGYPAKPRSLAFLADGALLASSGAQGAVLWPFTGGGPMGKSATIVGEGPDDALVSVVDGTPRAPLLAAGTSDGRVWVADLRREGVTTLRDGGGAAISALSLSPAGDRLAWGDEAGGAGVVAVAT